MGDLAHLIDHDIPEAKQELEGSYTNLERVAAYCEASYLQVCMVFRCGLLYDS